MLVNSEVGVWSAGGWLQGTGSGREFGSGRGPGRDSRRWMWGGAHLRQLPVPDAPSGGAARRLCKQARYLRLQALPLLPPAAPTGHGSWPMGWELRSQHSGRGDGGSVPAPPPAQQGWGAAYGELPEGSALLLPHPAPRAPPTLQPPAPNSPQSVPRNLSHTPSPCWPCTNHTIHQAFSADQKCRFIERAGW